MKKFKDLILEATSLCDEEYDNAQWAAWFNDGLNDLVEVLFITKRAIITANLDGTFTIPTDLKSVIRLDSITENIKPLTVGDDTSIGYRVIGDVFEIQGEKPSSISLLYYKYPAPIDASNIESYVDLSDRFTKALVLYACAQGMLREDETERFTLFNSEYQQFKFGIQTLMKAQMPARSGSVEVTR